MRQKLFDPLLDHGLGDLCPGLLGAVEHVQRDDLGGLTQQHGCQYAHPALIGL